MTGRRTRLGATRFRLRRGYGQAGTAGAGTRHNARRTA